MKRTAYIAINGILTNPGDSEGWTDRFVTWVNTRLPDGVVAEKFEYFTDALTRMLKQRERADAIAKKVGYYRRAGYRVVLVSHSNGGDLTARVLNDAGVEIDSAHLFAPATDDELIAQAIREGAVKRVHIYGSRNDGALKFAKATRPFIGWLGFGYGSLGLRGRELAAQFPAVVKDHSNDAYGHSTWFQRGAIFEETMKLIAANERDDLDPSQPPTTRL
jgi:hypothetical protein